MSDPADRRADLQQRLRQQTGIDEPMIARVVHGFYDRVRADPVLAPVFAARIGEADWPAHLGRMVRFWSAVILMDGGYHGRPMQAHATLPVDAAHFDRWLALFRDTAAALAPARAAAEFVERAERIAGSLEAGIALAQGRDLGRAGGFRMPEAAQ
jgi:hemoglobin